MFLSFPFPLIIALALSGVYHASGSITIPIERRLNSAGLRKVVAHDRDRSHYLFHSGEKSYYPKQTLDGKQLAGPPIENIAVAYVAQIGIGSPATDYSLIIDTGSANTWVNATKAYVVTNTSIKTDQVVVLYYGSGYFSGAEWLDRVTPGPGLVVQNQSIGVAESSFGFTGVDGVLGLGPADLSIGSLSPNIFSEIPTVTDNLYSQHEIANNTIGIGFKPFNSSLTSDLTWGAPNRSQYVGDLNYIPRTRVQPANRFWGINSSFSYGELELLSNGSGIVDAGSTLLSLRSDAYSAYQNATRSKYDSTSGLLYILPEQYTQLQNMTIIANGTAYVLTPDAQIWPRFLNEYIGGSTNYTYLTVGQLSPDIPIDFILGYTFLERYYAVFNSGNGSVGLAATNATYGVYNNAPTV